MGIKLNGNFNHYFRHVQYKEGKFQSDYVIFDVETNETKISETQKHLTFKLISYIFIENFEIVEKNVSINLDEFWIKFFDFVNEKSKIVCINNNIGFDIRASKAFHYLEKQNYHVSEKFYMKNRTLILPFIKKIEKETFQILFLDMQNYFAYQSVKDFGKAINLEKLEINFDKCSTKELKIYAIRDVEIIWIFFKHFIDFLIDNKLTSVLKPTLSSLAIEIYRTNFHQNKKIYVHNCTQAIKLERESYKGGISDVFLKDKRVDCFYVDINSMYAYMMKKTRLPARLIANLFEVSHSQDELQDNLQRCIEFDEYCCIANITYSLHEGYILNKKDDIICNVHGKFLNGSFCLPELEYILKHGKILKIHQMCVYETELLFDNYIDFFYEIKKISTGVIREFTKKFLTNLYGKWGQQKEEMLMFTEKDLQDNIDIIKNNEEKLLINNNFCHVACIIGEGDIYRIKDKLYMQKRKKTNAFDAFVAISSYITSSCRVHIISLKELSEINNQKGVYYVDTDSLFVNKIGYLKLKELGHIGEELGQLKLEKEHQGIEKPISCVFHAPKDYKIMNKTKCKGIKKTSIKIDENKYKVEEFESLNKAIKNNNLDKIIITQKIKIMKRNYKKGIVKQETGEVIPFILN